jgi:hypothetical protein
MAIRYAPPATKRNDAATATQQERPGIVPGLKKNIKIKEENERLIF